MGRTIRDFGGKLSRLMIDDFRFTIYFSMPSLDSVMNYWGMFQIPQIL
jgi:hypothetical protein